MTEPGLRALLAITAAPILEPLAITPNLPSNLRQPVNGADLLVITRHELMASLAPLVAARRSQGLSVSLGDVEDIFDEFSFGHKSVQAIKDFLAYTQASWKKRPRYALLVGDASYVPRNYLGFGATDLVSTRLAETRFMETASDDWFADFDDDGLATIAIGRLPVRTVEEAEAMVDKLVHYNQSQPSGEALTVADRNDGSDLEAASQALKPLLSGLRVNEVFRGRMGDAAAKQMLIDAINRGQGIVNYVEHGSAGQWRGDLLTSNDALALENSRLTLFVMKICLNGYFQDAAIDSLGESLLRAARGGAMAVWASSGMTTPDGQTLLNQELYRQMFGSRVTRGEAVRRAKAATGDIDVRRTWNLLGDPSMHLRR